MVLPKNRTPTKW